MLMHEDRLLPAEPGPRKIAKAMYAQVKSLSIVSPHGHTPAPWFVKNEPFPDPAKLLVQPDHYVYRMQLGPSWWFHDSPEGMMRFREQTTETAGFYNTVGFNDDTRAFQSTSARHDEARRIDCAFLAPLVAEHRLGEDEAVEVAQALTYGLVKKAYRL